MKDKILLIDGSESRNSYAVRNVKTRIMFNQSTLRVYDISSCYAPFPYTHPLSSFHLFAQYRDDTNLPVSFGYYFQTYNFMRCLTFDRRRRNLFVRLPLNPYTMMNKDHVCKHILGEGLSLHRMENEYRGTMAG